MNRYERMLRRELGERLDSACMLDASLTDLRSARGDGTADDEHDPEGSTLSSDWSRLEGLSAAGRRQVAAIERALGRIEQGTYGVCVRCGSPIAPARLDARPAAEFCIDCAQALERR